MMPTAHSGVESAHAALYQNAAAQAQLAAYQAAAARSATPQHAQPAVNQHQAVNPAAAHGECHFEPPFSVCLVCCIFHHRLTKN